MNKLADISTFESVGLENQSTPCFNYHPLNNALVNPAMAQRSQGPTRGLAEGRQVLQQMTRLQTVAEQVMRMGNPNEKAMMAKIYAQIIHAATFAFNKLKGDMNATITAARDAKSRTRFTYRGF